MVNALAVSCNAYFGQLALSLGPEPLQALVADGLEVRWRGDEIDPGPMGSRKLAETGFGQGALALSPMQAARMIAAAGDGQYRFCDPGHRLGEDCQHRELFSDPDLLAPVMAGMRKVVDAGTARAMPELAGVRVYGKTGTADDPVRTSERIYGVVKARPHSWFVALAEPAEGGGCAADNAGRLAVAVVATRAGYGSQVAMPAARAIIGAANGLGYFGETKAAP
jgi:cell division protein FtsI/penicillin-binding protein 2